MKNITRWVGWNLTVVLVLAAVPAHAAIELNPTGAGTASVVYQGTSYFSNPNKPWGANLSHTLIEKDFTSVGAIVFDPATYADSDKDWATGFR